MAPTTEVRHRGAAGDAVSADLVDPIVSDEDDSNTLLDPANDSRKLIGIDGNWYDITHFIDKHPGGPVIEQFIGQDATTVFHNLVNHRDALKYRKPVGTYKMRQRHPADAEFEELIKFFHKEGYFNTNWVFYAKKMSVVLILYLTVFSLVLGFSEWYMHYLGGVVLAFFWQQSGFIMHEFMHTQVTRWQKQDRLGGIFFGTVCFGFSSHWWRDEHIIHHGMTNVVDVSQPFVDPQMWESVWAQNTRLFPLYKGWLQYLLIKIQHITFVPVVTCFGRLEIITDSYIKERRWYEWIAIVLHWTWMCFLLSHLPTWREVVIFYIIAACVEGIFHFQLILSHYCKMFLDIKDFHNRSWFEYQVLSNMNIDTTPWLDWYYGGLNFHIEHHLFPQMARNNLRKAGKYVEDICKRHNIAYESLPFMGALWKTLKDLKRVGVHYKLDPR